MKVKETIAFIGSANETARSLIRNLAAQNHPLVLVGREEGHFLPLAAAIVRTFPQADVETLVCEKEGCWEADIIVLMDADVLKAELLEKIKEVAIQKILVYISGTGDHTRVSEERVRTVKRLLPYTEWVQVTRDPMSGAWSIWGAAAPATAIADIFAGAGYKAEQRAEVF